MAHFDTGPKLGQLVPEGENRRDAVHVAVAPVTAAEELNPGDHVGLLVNGMATKKCEHPDCTTIGIVDPFLLTSVKAGQRFWLFLYPGTITGLRHYWTHPAFTAAAQAVREQTIAQTVKTLPVNEEAYDK